MTRLKKALELAEKGFFVFPVIEGSKYPAIPAFPTQATRDAEKIRSWWSRRDFNIGISTTKFGEDKALVVVDVDNKNGKKGDEEVLRLEIEGHEFPKTFTQVTPTGGKHLIYVSDRAVKQGTSVLGKGLDIRSHGGYVVGNGSQINGKAYQAEFSEIEQVPEWIVEKCQRPLEKALEKKVPVLIDEKTAHERAIFYLKNEAPLAVQGDSGDQTTFKVAAKLKDFGVDPIDSLDLLFSYWNNRCTPPWSSEELALKVDNVYRYGAFPQGSDSPEAHFHAVTNPVAENSLEVHPVGKLNEEFSFLTKNSEVLWETVDFKGNKDLMYLTVSEFNNHLLSKVLLDGNGKSHQISKLWLRSPSRKSYISTCFAPGRDVPPQFFNLWRGFSVEGFSETEKIPESAKLSLKNLLDHIKVNVCENEEMLFTWFIGYFAHLIQKPYEKPLTCIVMKGRKGTGKNVVINCIARLIHGHALTVANRRYLTSNFNAHLERLLLLTLDEAFWSGDKASEGILKDLVTGETHLIERKGYDPYPVENLTRVVVIGNEDWVIPASEDERRYAVFSVGDGRRKDVKFFGELKDGMNKGGYRLLFDYLKKFDLSKIDVNVAPETKGLLEQKEESLGVIESWWREALVNVSFYGVHMEDPWPEEVNCDIVRESLKKYASDRNIRTWMPGSCQIGKVLRKCCKSLYRKRAGAGGKIRTYKLPTLEQARIEWEEFIGSKVDWED